MARSGSISSSISDVDRAENRGRDGLTTDHLLRSDVG
jgi:hypothetical protein